MTIQAAMAAAALIAISAAHRGRPGNAISRWPL